MVPRRARRVYDTLRVEQRTLQQGATALALSTAAGFVAGLVLGSITGTLELLPGLLVLIPASVGMRGMIFGAMGARLGTGIAAGVFEPTIRRGGLLSQNVEVAIISAVLSSFYLAGMAKLVASAFGEDTVSFWDLVTISVVGGVLASAVILVVTSCDCRTSLSGEAGTSTRSRPRWSRRSATWSRSRRCSWPPSSRGTTP